MSEPSSANRSISARANLGWVYMLAVEKKMLLSRAENSSSDADLSWTLFARLTYIANDMHAKPSS